MQFLCDTIVTRTFVPEKEESRAKKKKVGKWSDSHYMWNT